MYNYLLSSSLFGSTAPGQFGWCLFFAFVGAWISLQLDANKRKVQNPATPVNFSYRVLFSQNAKRLLLGFVVMFIMLRFMNEISGQALTEFTSFLAGLTIDRAIMYLRKIKAK